VLCDLTETRNKLEVVVFSTSLHSSSMILALVITMTVCDNGLTTGVYQPRAQIWTNAFPYALVNKCVIYKIYDVFIRKQKRLPAVFISSVVYPIRLVLDFEPRQLFVK
jgi:hypothetical protein